MKVFIHLSLIGLALCQTIPHGHDLAQTMDRVFGMLDKDGDSFVTETEFDDIQTRNDLNGDGCVTSAEYVAHNSYMPADWSVKFFAHFDHDGDGCLRINDMQNEFHIVDKNLDGHLQMHEYEKYYTHLTGTILGHHGK